MDEGKGDLGAGHLLDSSALLARQRQPLQQGDIGCVVFTGLDQLNADAVTGASEQRRELTSV